MKRGTTVEKAPTEGVGVAIEKVSEPCKGLLVDEVAAMVIVCKLKYNGVEE